jgi:hypothetical protein
MDERNSPGKFSFFNTFTATQTPNISIIKNSTQSVNEKNNNKFFLSTKKKKLLIILDAGK